MMDEIGLTDEYLGAGYAVRVREVVPVQGGVVLIGATSSGGAIRTKFRWSSSVFYGWRADDSALADAAAEHGIKVAGGGPAHPWFYWQDFEPAKCRPQALHRLAQRIEMSARGHRLRPA